MKEPQKAALPPGIDSTEGALSLLDKTYHIDHRGGDPGYYIFEKKGEGKGEMLCVNPYLCAFDLGVIQTFMELYRTPGSVPTLKHSDEGCRMDGNNLCKYFLEW